MRGGETLRQQLRRREKKGERKEKKILRGMVRGKIAEANKRKKQYGGGVFLSPCGREKMDIGGGIGTEITMTNKRGR